MGGSLDGNGGAPSTGGFEEGRERRQRRIVVAFRGTCSSTNWKTDCRCWHPTSISDFYDSESLEHTASLFTDTSSAILERYEERGRQGERRNRPPYSACSAYVDGVCAVCAVWRSVWYVLVNKYVRECLSYTMMYCTDPTRRHACLNAPPHPQIQSRPHWVLGRLHDDSI